MKKIIAWYLPQFHEFEENNNLWGKGFTEWVHLEKAISQYPNHHIMKPHPDIGYYCLSDTRIRKLQGELAKKFGVYGFCYYHYWFYDRPLMQKPLELMLSDGYPNLPFCLSWANEAWRNSMNGGDSRILVPQIYGEEDQWLAHFDYLFRFFRNPNYIKIDGKPLFLIYKVSDIDCYIEMFDYWRKLAKKADLNGLFLVSTLGNFLNDYPTEIERYIDATVEFFPNFLGRDDLIFCHDGRKNFYNIDLAFETIANFPKYHKRQFSGTMVNFDNSPRNCLRCNIFVGASPSKFYDSLYKKYRNATEEFIFVNAWNEWSESAVLEPESKYGYSYLNVIKRVVANNKIWL